MKFTQSETILKFPGRVGIIQRVLPLYRSAFFNAMARACVGGISVFAGKSRESESIGTVEKLIEAGYEPARNWELFHPHAPPYFLWQAGLRNWLNGWDPDVLIVEANARYLSARAALRWMHRRCRPVIGWGLGVPRSVQPSSESGYFATVKRKLWRNFLLSFDALIAYSQQGARQYEDMGFPENRVFIAPNAVAPRPVGSLPARPPRFEGRSKILFVGRLQARKRLDNLLKACASLPKDLQPQVWIVGEGPARRELESLAAQIYPHAEFFGELRGAGIKPYFAEADLFVLPGTGGLAVQEAMAAGLPVIVAQGDGTQADMVRLNQDQEWLNGWLIPPDDGEALHRTLKLALSDPQRLRRMGSESYRITVEEYNLENMVAVFVNALSMVNTWAGDLRN